MSAQHALWHPFADMGAVEHDRMVITRGEGSYVWDDAGRRYFDATASLWYANFGHGRPEITEAVTKQLRTSRRSSWPTASPRWRRRRGRRSSSARAAETSSTPP
jgi:adenosylmethionine-8-amino-7-oxononanoate aminotransferase